MNRDQLLDEFEKLGKEWGEQEYGELDENQIAGVAFGLFPVEIMNKAEDVVRTSVAKAVINKLAPNQFELEEMKPHVLRDIVNRFQHGVVLGLMTAAKECGKMVA